ncbi:hypothetical protein FN846DRAFT_686705 [Sphaerosporella brunnea]|uniref:Uncharacterized protein n=1 Tax=Sphaerosporella brunnea TaxID=1250544 RepID=A0A5J5EZN5_9PEZI|nr:hypothetical protein FN846DRAFT_686705 [Sphaerosporella brunnea]
MVWRDIDFRNYCVHHIRRQREVVEQILKQEQKKKTCFLCCFACKLSIPPLRCPGSRLKPEAQPRPRVGSRVAATVVVEVEVVSAALDSFYSCPGTLFFVTPRGESFDLFPRGIPGRQQQQRGGGSASSALSLRWADTAVTMGARAAFSATVKVFLPHLARVRYARLCAVRYARDYGAAHCRMGVYFPAPATPGSLGAAIERRGGKIGRPFGCIPEFDHNIDPATVFDTIIISIIIITVVMGVNIDGTWCKRSFLMCDVMQQIYAADVCSLRAMQAGAHGEAGALAPGAAGIYAARFARSRRRRRQRFPRHLMYLGVTRKTVVEMGAGSWERRHFHNVCLDAATQVAEIVGILLDDSITFRRCRNQSFTACAPSSSAPKVTLQSTTTQPTSSSSTMPSSSCYLRVRHIPGPIRRRGADGPLRVRPGAGGCRYAVY